MLSFTSLASFLTDDLRVYSYNFGQESCDSELQCIVGHPVLHILHVGHAMQRILSLSLTSVISWII